MPKRISSGHSDTVHHGAEGNTLPVGHLASQALRRVFEQYQDRHFTLVIPGGNHGDYLIYLGMRMLARTIGIHFRELACADFIDEDTPSNSVVYIHGSGGFVPWQSSSPALALEKAIRTHRGPVIVGPSTVHLDPSYLSQLFATVGGGPRAYPITFVARERYSYDALKMAAPACITVALDHDTALNVQRDDVLRHIGAFSQRRHYSLYAIRTDKERSATDFSRACAFPVDPIRYCRSFTQWLALHACARKIVTNRLHSSILGSILGVPTTLLPNSYHKNRAVWEYSLRDRGVLWCEELPISGVALVRKSVPLADAFLQRRSIRQIIGRIRFGHLPS